MIKNLKIPIRTCIGCQCKKPKKEMIRIIRTPEGKIEIDKTGKKSGRGAYLCDNVECLDIALKKNSLSKSLKKNILLKTIDELRNVFLKIIYKNID
jgi:hypothetical protein